MILYIQYFDPQLFETEPKNSSKNFILLGNKNMIHAHHLSILLFHKAKNVLFCFGVAGKPIISWT